MEKEERNGGDKREEGTTREREEIEGKKEERGRKRWGEKGKKREMKLEGEMVRGALFNGRLTKGPQ